MEIVGIVLVALLILAAIQRTPSMQAKQKKKSADHSWQMHQAKMRNWDKMKEEQMTPVERRQRAAYLAQVEEENKRRKGEQP